ncbi:hypothetical protein PYCC9005_002411 [Savitreella phatthalungensis]
MLAHPGAAAMSMQKRSDFTPSSASASATDVSKLPLLHHLQTLSGFSAIGSLEKPYVLVDLIGRVDRFGEAKLTRKGEYCKSIVLCDPSASNSHEGLMLQFYRFEATQLPSVAEGCFMVLKRFKTATWNGGLQAWTNDMSSWAVFDQAGTQLLYTSPNIAHLPMPPTIRAYVKRLAGWTAITKPNVPACTFDSTRKTFVSERTHDQSVVSSDAPTTTTEEIVRVPVAASYGRKTCLIKDLEPRKFYDVYGYVVKLFQARDDAYTAYITDYTRNDLLLEYNEFGADRSDGSGGGRANKQWRGPLGKLTMQVTLWQANAWWAKENMKEGQYVLIKNMRTKLNHQNVLEGQVDGDRRYPDKVLVHELEPEEALVRPIRVRKTAYEMSHKRLLELAEDERKQEQQRKKLEAMPKPTNVNPNVQCSYEQVPVSPIADILSPQLTTTGNNKLPPATRYRIMGKVVDFFPTDIRDFCKPWCRRCQATCAEPVWHTIDGEYEDESGPETVDEDGDASVDMTDFPVEGSINTQAMLMTQPKEHPPRRTPRRRLLCTDCNSLSDLDEVVSWVYAFTTLVEDADHCCLPVIWSGSEVCTLLGLDMDEMTDEPPVNSPLEPCDLRDPRNAKTVDLLRQKLFNFWGDLEERLCGEDGLHPMSISDSPSVDKDRMRSVERMFVEVCVAAYTIPGNGIAGSAGWGGRRYKGFGTRIL